MMKVVMMMVITEVMMVTIMVMRWMVAIRMLVLIMLMLEMVRPKLILAICSGGDSNDDVAVDDVGGVNTNGSDDAYFHDGDSKFDCGDDKDGGDGDD